MWSMPVPGEEVILFVSFEKLYGFVVAICLSVFVCFVFLELNDLIIAYQALSTSELYPWPLFFHWRVSLWRLCWPAVCESLPFACHGLESPGSVFCAYVSDSSWITFCVKNKIFTEAVFSMWISTHLRSIRCKKNSYSLDLECFLEAHVLMPRCQVVLLGNGRTFRRLYLFENLVHALEGNIGTLTIAFWPPKASLATCSNCGIICYCRPKAIGAAHHGL